MLKHNSAIKLSPWQRLGVVASLPLLSLLAAGCDAVQPRTQCKVRPQQYAAKYILKSMTGNCTDKILTGEALHLGYFRDAKDYAEGAPSVAILPASVADAVAGAMTHTDKEYSIGKFISSTPNSADICTAPELTESAIMTGMANLGYKWTNFQIVVRPSSHAFHWGADLVRKDGDCTANYKATVSSPVVHCGNGMSPKLDEMGMPVKDPQGNVVMEKDPTKGGPDDSLCNTDPLEGSLAPNLAWVCDATADGKGSHLCVPKYEFPALDKK
jgi:hypothetical protein